MQLIGWFTISSLESAGMNHASRGTPSGDGKMFGRSGPRGALAEGARIVLTNAIIATFSMLALVFVGSSALAKGKTVMLTISGPGIPRPIELTDADAISASAWGNDFFDATSGPVTAPAPAIPRYVVRFHVQPPRRRNVEMKYAVYFVWDRRSGRTMVYLPEPRDELYRLNSAMIREGQEGNWYLASEKWGRAVRAALPQP
jgi:hypothetical protein